jgi:hypothetical protein
LIYFQGAEKSAEPMKSVGKLIMINRISVPARSLKPQLPILNGFLLPADGALSAGISCRRWSSEDFRNPHQVVGGADDQREELRYALVP